jgi:two-component SAPR family response regulator
MMKKPLLFIVDDERDICTLVSTVISKCFNVDVEFALSFSSALKQLEFVIPDYVILDIHLGDGEGYDLVEKIKKVNPRVKILFISAFSEDKVCNKVDALNLEGLLHKPFDTLLLKSKLRKMMGINGDKG